MSIETRSLLNGRQEEVEIITTVPQSGNNTTSMSQASKLLAEQQGDPITPKSVKTFRIGFININGLTHTARNPKNFHIKQQTDIFEFDHLGMAETNCNWRYMDDHEKWHDRARTMWRKSKSVVHHNTTDITKEIKQPGGVLNITIGDAVASAIEYGGDKGMGRWSWVTLKGRNNVKTTIITGYRPCRNVKDDNSTYNQQL